MLVKTPAKINLFLEVIGKREDGYHEVETVLLKVGLHDRLTFSPRVSGIELSCDYPGVPSDETNLVCRAAGLLQARTGCSAGVSIHLEKSIPCGAGLGGGSSDAAATLQALNRFWKLDLSPEVLMELGRELGADVPFFLMPQSAAIGRGRGDILEPFLLTETYQVLLVIPPLFVSTAEVFRNIEPYLTDKKNGVKLLVYALKSGDLSETGRRMFNRLEQVSFKLYSQLAQTKQRILSAGAGNVLMTGSGSVFFCLNRNREEAARIKRELRDFADVVAVASL